nr:MAG: replication initiator protein [Microviridae sp.]
MTMTTSPKIEASRTLTGSSLPSVYANPSDRLGSSCAASTANRRTARIITRLFSAPLFLTVYGLTACALSISSITPPPSIKRGEKEVTPSVTSPSQQPATAPATSARPSTGNSQTSPTPSWTPPPEKSINENPNTPKCLSDRESVDSGLRNTGPRSTLTTPSTSAPGHRKSPPTSIPCLNPCTLTNSSTPNLGGLKKPYSNLKTQPANA